ncbi:MAG: hypothetical protein JJ911_03770 [Rhizobiaceae bacterium]|nr:hypothetical protein [Rhizobiaceae bacterium]
MFRKLWNDRGGNYALLTAVAITPLMGSLALGVDYAFMSQQRQDVLNALDAAGIATARYISGGGGGDAAKQYAQDFFAANLNSADASKAILTVVLPADNAGGGTLKLSAKTTYEPYFLGAFTSLLGGGSSETELAFNAVSEVRLKNTLEVALVLDNSGSMDYLGSGSGKKRMVLLKEAAKQLVDTIAAEGAQMKKVSKPVQFAVVPFAASVNVGAANKTAAWMDQDGLSPIHHENFDWSTMPTNRKVTKSGGVYYKMGSGWGAAENQKVTRFTMFDDLQRITGYDNVLVGTTVKWVCTSWYYSSCSYQTVPVYDSVPSYGPYASWQGCVEARPHPYNISDAPPVSSTPATLFVPMFAPDETDRRDSYNRRAENDWWDDLTSSTDSAYRQKYMLKYFEPAAYGTSLAASGRGPNASCTTKAITPLSDVTTHSGKTAVTDAIDAMTSNGATNVPEGMAWGWRAVSSGAPFTEGRLDSENGNDKVVIVLTDGQNTYYTPGSLGYNDLASNRSIYSSYGYSGKGYNGTSTTRLFMGTSPAVGKSDYSNGNYTDALNEQFAALCDNAKSNRIIVMTVSLDLSWTKTEEKAQIEALKTCASESRYRKDPSDPSKPAKLYWNATGSNLADKFKEISEELSNLRIVG